MLELGGDKMRVLVVGGTGHIGSYLVPRLLRAGHEVAVVSRRQQSQYTEARMGWDQVEWINADIRAEEEAGTWGDRMKKLEADAVVDLLSFTPQQNQVMVEAFKGRIDHFLHCGTIWAYGPVERAPARESDPRKPITQYGIDKAAIEVELRRLGRHENFPFTVIHPGHISGRRWFPIDPQGTRNGPEVYRKLATGEVVHLPDLGLATVHHVHGDDVAQFFQLALEQPQAAMGESFSAVAPYAMSLLGCCRAVASLFGRKANIELVPLADLEAIVGSEAFEVIAGHVEHSPCSSMEKGQRLLGYRPRYTTEEIFAECVEHMLESELLVL
jgi:nucleoside-diphosphate-sugar epimerase